MIFSAFVIISGKHTLLVNLRVKMSLYFFDNVLNVFYILNQPMLQIFINDLSEYCSCKNKMSLIKLFD